MRIAVMLALHNNPEQANCFIKQCINNDDCHVFIHIDKKGLDIKDKLISHPSVHIMPKSFSVSWGDFTQIEYVIELMKFIREYGRFDYYSIHSGNDLMVRPYGELAEFLEKDNKYAYLECYRLPWKEWQYGGGLGRIALHWPKWARSRLKPHSLQRYIRSLYGKLYGAHVLKGKKLPEDISFWGRSAWYTLREDCVDNCLKYLDEHTEFLELFRHSLCGDEIFIDTLANITGSDEIIEENNNLRYVDFDTLDKKNVGAPKTLTMDDIEKIKTSGAFFARKFDMKMDERVVRYYLSN